MALLPNEIITRYIFQEYENATKEENCNPEVWVNLACTYFFLGMYKQAEAAGFKGKRGSFYI
jgi:hypothetical protein